MSLSHTAIEKPSEVTHRWLSTHERGVCNRLILSLSLLSVLYKVQQRGCVRTASVYSKQVQWQFVRADGLQNPSIFKWGGAA